ncbi:MAG: hypothetical protein AAGG44_15645, partial [Planctomycetota bacterium]
SMPIYNFCHGLFLGLANGACLWLVLGRTRFSLRYLPLLGVISLELVICVLTFTEVRFAGEALVSTLVPAIVACIPMIGIRLAGFRFQLITNPSGAAEDLPENQDDRKRLSIRDLLLASFGFAVFVACLKPALEAFQVPTIDVRILIGTGIWMLTTAVLLTCGQSRLHRLRQLVAVLAIAILAAILVESLYTFVTGQTFGLPRMDQILVIGRVLAAATLTQYCIHSIYAAHGWRLTRAMASAAPA